MKMHKSMRLFALLLSALFFTAATQAQAQSGPTKKDRTAGTKQKQDRHEAGWQDELKLTPEQKAKVKAADDEYRTKSKASRDANRNDMDQLREERKRAHRSVLSREQSKKYDEIMTRKEAKKGEKHAKKHSKKTDKMKGKKKERGEEQRGSRG